MIVFDSMQLYHWPTVKTIYEEGVAAGNATFQQSAPEWKEWNKSHLNTYRIVAKNILSWMGSSHLRIGRCVYAGVAEVSVYINTEARGRGIEKQLLEKLVEESEAHDIWTLQAGISLKISPA